MSMREIRLLAALLSLLPPAALAADLPVKAAVRPDPIIWSGAYVGVEGGWATAQSSQTNVRTNTSLGYFNQDGGLAGGTLGYNWQRANWVLGLETDLAWADIRGAEHDCGPRRNETCATEIKSFGTVRGRAATTILDNNTLLYLAGGLAYADIRAYKEATAISGGEGWKAGWTIGGGFETMFVPHWSVKLEYLYADFTGAAATYTILSNNNSVAADERRVHMVRGGVNWHF